MRRLPGIGEKSATRLAFHLLSAPESQVQELAEAIVRLKQEIVLCAECFDLTDASPCAICRDARRDASQLCVVEEPADLAAIEAAAATPVATTCSAARSRRSTASAPTSCASPTSSRACAGAACAKLILATNPTAEGDATAHYLADRLRGSGVRTTRIACGMPLGGDLEYADPVTIGRSLANRRELE